jgi:hypothetical protein
MIEEVKIAVANPAIARFPSFSGPKLRCSSNESPHDSRNSAIRSLSSLRDDELFPTLKGRAKFTPTLRVEPAIFDASSAKVS